MSRSAKIKALVFVGLIAAAITIQLIVGLPSQDEIRETFDGLGAIAIPVFIVVYVGASMLPVGPSGVLTIVGGLVFGFAIALPSVLFAAIVASALAFVVGRKLGRDAVKGLSSERIKSLDRSVGEHGFATVLLARLVPLIPFTTANYAFGVTSVSFRNYVTATALGIVPGTSVYVAVGAFGADPTSPAFLAAIGGLVVLTLAGVWRSRKQGSSASTDAPEAEQAVA